MAEALVAIHAYNRHMHFKIIIDDLHEVISEFWFSDSEKSQNAKIISHF